MATDQFTFPPQYTQDQPVQIGHLVDEAGFAQAPVPDGWVGSARMSPNRILYVAVVSPEGGGIRPEMPAHAELTTVNETILIPAPGVGRAIWVTDITGSNEGSVLTRVELKDGIGGAIRYRFAMARQGGGFAHSLKTPWPLPANTPLVVKQSATSIAYVTVNYEIRDGFTRQSIQMRATIVEP